MRAANLSWVIGSAALSASCALSSMRVEVNEDASVAPGSSHTGGTSGGASGLSSTIGGRTGQGGTENGGASAGGTHSGGAGSAQGGSTASGGAIMGGSSATGGLATGGGPSTSGGASAIGGTTSNVPPAGGANAGGSSGLGGNPASGGQLTGGLTSTGGTRASGGLGSNGGTSSTLQTGGAATGGTATGAATGGAATGGAATGGAATGGTATGGAATGGAATGGAATGGVATGGAATGGAATGGAATGGVPTGGSTATTTNPVNCSAEMPTRGQQHSGSSQGTAGSLSWQVWSNMGSGSMTTFGSTPAFSATWNNSGDFLAYLGLQWDQTKTFDAYGTITAEFAESRTGSGGAYSFIGVYGWSVDPCVEWYILDDWFGSTRFNPGTTKIGTADIDGGKYDLYSTSSSGTSLCTGVSRWQQFYSIRQTARTCGPISVTEHFLAWQTAGMSLGKLDSAKILVEVAGGGGTINFSTANVKTWL